MASPEFTTPAAVTAALTSYALPTPVGLEAMIVMASALANRALQGRMYDTDSNGLPSNTLVLESLEKAVTQQIVGWVAAGVNPLVPGGVDAASGTATIEESIGDATIKFAAEATEQRGAKIDSLTSLSPAAAACLDWVPRGSVWGF